MVSAGSAQHAVAAARSSQRIVRAVRSDLRRGDVCAALQVLNARTRFRFTGLYHVDPPLLRNLALFDRENPAVNVSGQVSPLTIGFCGFVCAIGAPFVTSDARHDPLLASHPARESMLSYCGVPVRSASGLAWGTLCHFDLRPRLAPAGEVPMLESVVPLFVEWLAAARSAAASRGAALSGCSRCSRSGRRRGAPPLRDGRS